ncbi:hypothetical protein FB645_001607 [Coemansia sp. IMI 203386]|nr:hypothetical protein FB645_001607 [Coemansia sp. IMI 203386]
MSDKEINYESRKLGLIYGCCAVFVASVLGGKALGLKPKMNIFSSIATGAVTGYMWHGFTRQAFQKKRRQLLEDSSTSGSYSAATPSTSPSDEFSGTAHSISTVPVPVQGTRDTRTGASKSSEGTGVSQTCKTIDRTWDQCEWLHKKIQMSFRLQVLPPFPKMPSVKKAHDTLYIERQRARMERWLNRVGSREDLSRTGSMDYFISSKMTDKDVGGSSKQSFSSLFMNLFGGPAEQEFVVYTPIGDINDYNEDEEERKREYINNMEECAHELENAIKNMHVQEEAFGKGVVKATMAIEKAFDVDAIAYVAREALLENAAPASFPESGPADIKRDRLQVSLALLQSSAEAYYWSTKELSIWKEYNFVDTMAEYGLMVGNVKEVMNHSTQMLIMYEKAMQLYQGHVSKANSLRVQYPSETPSVKYANEQESQSERELELAQQEYTDACDMANTELIRYERERAQGMRKALENMASLELDSARARLQELKSLRRRIKSVQMTRDPPHPRTNIGPLLWHAAGSTHPSMLTPRVSSSSFPRTAPPDSSLTFNDRMTMGAYGSGRPAHRHSNSSSSSGSRIVGSMYGGDNIFGPGVKRAHTVDNADFSSVRGNVARPMARNHSVFMETDEDDEEDQDTHSQITTGSSSKFPWAEISARGSPSPLQQRMRWNGRISAMPFQGYDPTTDTEPRPLVDQDRLAEIAAEAEMEAELVRSGMLAARQATRQKSTPNASHALFSPNTTTPPILPAFRPSAGARQLRQVSSLTGISSIPQPVSPSEYLQYSRQTLHSSLSHVKRSSSATTSGESNSARSASSGSRSPRLPRRDKGKARAFAV